MQEIDQVTEQLPVLSRERTSAVYFRCHLCPLALGYFLMLKQNSLEDQIYYIIRNIQLPVKAGVNK